MCINGKYSSSKSLPYSVPQGSCSGVNIFTAYCSPIIDVIPNDIAINSFKDDHSIHKEFNPSLVDHEVQTIAKFEGTLTNISSWMDAMHLKLNGNKTECIPFGSHKQLTKCNSRSLTVNSNLIEMSESVHFLGVCENQELRFINHLTAKCRAATSKLVNIKPIKKYLNKSSCETVGMGLVISHQQDANYMLYRLPDLAINRLQWVQNMAAKLVLNRSRYLSSTESISTGCPYDRE